MQPMTVKTQKIILRTVAVIGFVLFMLEWLYYLLEAYLPFIHHQFGWDTYLPSALRMLCRMGYPVALVGIFFYKRWAAFLLVAVWLMQLVPSTVFFLLTSGQLHAGHFSSFVELSAVAALLYWCRNLLGGSVRKPLLLFILITLLAHTALYLSVHGDTILGVQPSQLS